MKINVRTEMNKIYKIESKGGNLLSILQDHKVEISNLCQGNGTCGKCKVKVLKGNLPITESDRTCLTKKELEQGIRLACKAVISENEILLSDSEILEIEILASSDENILVESISVSRETQENVTEDAEYFLAIDIGTTTIAMVLIKSDTKEICDVYTSLNHQRKYGADIISRIVAANEGKSEELKKLIEEDLQRGIIKLTKEGSIPVSHIIIAGNTTMIHLLMGYDCQTLGKFPFYSEHLEQIECLLKECITTKERCDKEEDGISKKRKALFVENNVFENLKNIPVTIFPGISAFVGGDVVADIITCQEFETEELTLLIDLGTNGEMVLGNKDKLLVTSTAAGPAFEGGNISCGTASIPGSICRVKIQNHKAIVKTIKDQLPPVGICGTGLISAIAQLKQNKLIDTQGKLNFPYSEKGYSLWSFESGEKMILSQKDIREFQMAKAAIRAGIEILMKEFGCKEHEIQKIYIAGGFGKALVIEDTIITGMLPEIFRGRIHTIGNGALKGAVCLGKGSVSKEQMNRIRERSKNISLSQKTEFQKKYLEYMLL